MSEAEVTDLSEEAVQWHVKRNEGLLDTNVLHSALIFSHGAPEIIYHAWRDASFDLVTSVTRLEELRRVFCFPKLKSILPFHRVGAMINNMRSVIVLESLSPVPVVHRLSYQQFFAQKCW